MTELVRVARVNPAVAGELIETLVEELGSGGRRRRREVSEKRALRLKAGARLIAEALQKVIRT